MNKTIFRTTILVGIVLGLAGKSSGDVLSFQLKNSQVNQPFAVVSHIDGATLGFDPEFDANRTHPTQPNRIDIYSQIPGHDLGWNSLPVGNLIPVTNRVDGLSLTVPVNVNFQTVVIFENGEFTGRVLNIDIYQIVGGIPVFQVSHDARVITNSANSVPIIISNGHSYNLVFRPENIPPTAINSVSIGSKYNVRNGSFDVSDSGGTITNVALLNSVPGFAISGGTNWTWSPAGFVGSTNLFFYAQDNDGGNSTTNNLLLISTNAPPLALDASQSALAEASAAFSLGGSDADAGDLLSYGITSNPTNGTIENLTGSNIVYRSANNVFGSGADHFVFSVSDGYDTSTATVTLNITATNRVPAITNISVSGGSV